MVVTITNPAPNGAFPNVIEGTYSFAGPAAAPSTTASGPAQPSVKVHVDRNGANLFILQAVLAPAPGGAGGTWTANKPAPLASPANNFEIVAILTFGPDETNANVTGISN